MAATTVRSASSTPSDAAKKKFACSHPGCGKSFSRSEHLHRHSLNHKEGNNTCHRCSAHFRRRDLLDRHMARHKEKDDEAGGEGLGHLATRKRLWKDADGKIIQGRRPYQQEGDKRRQSSSASSDSQSSAGSNKRRKTNEIAPPSPPHSIDSANGPTIHDAAAEMILQDPWPMNPPMPPSSDNGDQFDFLCNASWGAPAYQPQFPGPHSADLPYDDIFKPDTAMSFNAPFTTMSYYNWLFENEGAAQQDPSLAQERMPVISAAPSYASSTSDDLSGSLSPTSVDPHLLSQDNYNQDAQYSLGEELAFSSVQQPLISPALAELRTQEYSSPREDNSPFPLNYESSINQSMFTAQSQGTYGSSISSAQSQRSPSITSPVLPDVYSARSSGRLPTITNQAREGLMDIIRQSKPTKPDGSEISCSDPLLSLLSLQHYSDLFFTRFNSSYPLIHQATFRSSDVHPYLLMAILLLGATYSDKEAHLLAVCIHDIMRPLIHASKEFGTRPKLFMLQTILLVECFGKSRAGEKQHDMSHLYHGLLINLIRRSDCQSASISPYDPETHELEDYWQMAVTAEEKRRLALLCFMWDTQHAVLFSQSLCMNASELMLSLPWDPVLWTAESAREWFLLQKTIPDQPQYLTILKAYTNPSPSFRVPEKLNALSRVLIFHGLMSISWDLSRRSQTSVGLSLSSNSFQTWHSIVAGCYDRWRLDFDNYTNAVLSSLKASPDDRAKFQRFTVANLAIYHTAMLILNIDIIDLQIIAGAKHIIGRPVTISDRNRSKRKISQWVEEDGGLKAATATWHAGWIFRDGIRKLDDWGVDSVFHYPWCLYLSTLVVWMFHAQATKGQAAPQVQQQEHAQPPRRSEKENDEDGDWDAKVEMNALVSAITRLDREQEIFVREMWDVMGRFKVESLVRCMARQLCTVRWAVVREGMIVLRGLAPL